MEQLDLSLINIEKEIKNTLKEIDNDVLNLTEFKYNLLGKAIRSRFTMLFSSSLNLPKDKAEKIAIVSELTHNASLLHDDCIDNALRRRGQPTINAALGINKAILIGDLVISIAFKYAQSLSCDISNNLVETVRKMTEGALIEENNKYSIITMEQYKKMVSYKTSSLFRWITLSATSLSDLNHFEKSARIAENFGLSFQIIDDILDLTDENNTGKDKFKDLSEGKITMPILLSLEDEKISGIVKEKINKFFNSNPADYSMVLEILEILKENRYIEKSRKMAIKLIEDIREDALSIVNKKEAINFYSYIYSIAERNK
jgi:octaprenyl-diphosphate synthase